ncbi:MAG: FKBP-type peptidyl-prolyl cis-trans isomerase [Ignavibacteriaceae bacterium]|nr:FKBP-type peptidyl-prolyl cis-trans isomerase [Ignavibacteriaceae bacterium]
MKVYQFIAVIFIVLVLIGCEKKPEVIKRDSGLLYANDTLGTGVEVKKGDLITIHYNGWIIKDSSDLYKDWSNDSTKLQYNIGSSYDKNQPIKFILGNDSFIKGTDEGIVGMKVGGTRTIIIPSGLAYGKLGMGPVPPNSSLKVVVTVLAAKEAPKIEQWKIDNTSLTTTKSGLKYGFISKGAGQKVESGKLVTVHYSGFLEDGSRFDSSFERDEPFSFVIGEGQVIPGWEEGIALMRQGDKVKLIIPPALAYGSTQVGTIPPNSTLYFDVEVLNVQ